MFCRRWWKRTDQRCSNTSSTPTNVEHHIVANDLDSLDDLDMTAAPKGQLGVAELGGLLILLGVGLVLSVSVSVGQWLWVHALTHRRRHYQLQRGGVKSSNRHNSGQHQQQPQHSSGSGRHRTSNAVSCRNGP